ncbi:MAG: ribonuclease P protein component [Microcoleaceae cyanobacterium]
MLPQQHRLRRPQDFKRVYSKGRRYPSRHLTLRAVQQLTLSPSGSQRLSRDYQNSSIQPLIQDSQSTQSPSRFGISISQKVSKRAVVRNRIKRQIRARLRERMSDFKPGWDLVVVVKPGTAECNSVEFLQELEQLLVKAEVLNGHSGGDSL